MLTRLSITTTNVGSETAAIWLVSLCVSISITDRLIPARSCQTSDNWWTIDSSSRCVSTVSISLKRRSRGGLSGEPPSRRSRHISTNDCSTVNSILVPSGWTSSVTNRDPAGSCDCAPDHVACVLLIASSSTGLRSSVESLVTDVWQKVSIARAIRR